MPQKRRRSEQRHQEGTGGATKLHAQLRPPAYALANCALDPTKRTLVARALPFDASSDNLLAAPIEATGANLEEGGRAPLHTPSSMQRVPSV